MLVYGLFDADRAGREPGGAAGGRAIRPRLVGSTSRSTLPRCRHALFSWVYQTYSPTTAFAMAAGFAAAAAVRSPPRSATSRREGAQAGTDAPIPQTWIMPP